MFFCSDHSREIQEDIIGSANYYQAYILVECPQPWAYHALESKWVPENLQLLAQEIKHNRLPIKLLLISDNESHRREEKSLLIYQREHEFANHYRKHEFKLKKIEEVALIIRKWLWLGDTSDEITSEVTRDILVCTHGSHDKCCSRYGNPFFYAASALISDLKLQHIKIWKSSHFGGHRFAPTAIDLSDGRYYGRLDIEAFREILLRVGSVELFQRVYRGWSILPPPLQVLERELILSHGWDWFDYKIMGRISEQNQNNSLMLGEISFETTDGYHYLHQAQITCDESKNVTVKGSCNASKESLILKYSVANPGSESLVIPKYVRLGHPEVLKTAS